MPNNHHYKLRDLSFSCSCVLCRVLRWINTYYLCAVCRVRAWYVWILFKCGYIRFMLNSLYSVFNV